MKRIILIAALATPLLAQAGTYTSTHIGRYDYIDGPNYDATVTHIGRYDYIDGTRNGHHFSGTVTHIGRYDYIDVDDD